MQRDTVHKLGVYTLLYVILGGIIASIFLVTPQESSAFGWLRILIIFFASILLTKYFIYMMVSPWNEVRSAYVARQARHKKRATATPLVSIIVPAWNEQVGIITTVKALLESTYQNIEILVVDNASTDNTGPNVRALCAEHEAALAKHPQTSPRAVIRYIYEGSQGKGHALNRGLKEAKGDIIMSIDADCYIPPQTVGKFVACFEDPLVMAAVGNVRIGNTNTILGVIQYLEFLFSFYFKKAESLVNTIYIIGGAAGAFRREVFERVGPYNHANITEDIELSVRIQAHGMKIVYASDALVYTEGAVTLNGLKKQRLRWKRGRFETFRDHRYLFFSRSREHNKILAWFILPLAIIGELQLSLEILFLAFLYAFSFVTGDFTSFISGIVVVSSMFIVQVLFDEHRDGIWRFLLLAPIGWLLFYVSTYVETSALFKALSGYVRKQELTWQKWDRQGVFQRQSPH